MRRTAVIILGIITIWFFLNIAVSYNSRYDQTILAAIQIFLAEFNSAGFFGEDNLHQSVSEILITLLLFAVAIAMGKKTVILVVSSFLLFIWLKNYLVFNGIIDGKKYLETSVYFLVSITVLNLVSFFYKSKPAANH